jgi:hypothetical protein
METKGKFIIQLTGPAVKYRLDILAKVCPEARHFLLCLTNKFSYPLYKEYHDFFTFIIMDDYRKDYPVSLEKEIFPEFKTEEEYFSKIKSFYGSESGVFYPYDISRFIFPYLLENNILNFAITDTDFILDNNPEVLNKFFENIEPGTLYGPWHGEDSSSPPIKRQFFDELQPLFPQIKFEGPFFRTFDGFVRGCHFKNKEDMTLLYNIWNQSLEKLMASPYYLGIISGHNGAIIHTEWIISYIMQFFQYDLGYNFKDYFSISMVDNINVGRHYTRPEDTLYLGPRECWEYIGFDYSDTSTISAFIKNNKKQLAGYYAGTFNVEITDTHIYTKL